MSTKGSFIMHAQYVRDLSFENHYAPFAFSDEAPGFDVSLDVNAREIEGSTYEVALSVLLKAVRNEEVIFLVELEYAMLTTIESVGTKTLEEVLFIECPNVIFPFARRVMSDVVRDGGYPAVMINPVDFNELYAMKEADGKLNILRPQANPNAATVN